MNFEHRLHHTVFKYNGINGIGMSKTFYFSFHLKIKKELNLDKIQKTKYHIFKRLDEDLM